MVCSPFKRIKYFTRVGINMRAYNKTIIKPIELQFTEPWEFSCGGLPLQYTENWNERCGALSLQQVEGWNN